MKKKQIILFVIVILCFWSGQYIYVPTLTPYAKSIGSSVYMIGLIGGSYGLIQFLLRIPIGIISDITGKRKLNIIVGMLFVLLSGLCFLTSNTPYGVLAARSMAGVAASFWVVFTVMFHSNFKSSDKAIGLLSMCQMSGVTFSTLLGGWISQNLGQKAPFITTVAMSSLGLVLTIFLKENKEEKDPMKLSELLETGRNKAVLFISITGLVYQFVSFGSAYVFTPLVAKNLGMGDTQIGFLTFLFSLPGIFAGFLIGTSIFKKAGYGRSLGTAFIFMAVPLLFIVYTKSLTVLYIAQFIFGLGRGISYSILMLLVVMSVPESKKATAMGFFQASYALGMFAGPYLTGLISQNFSLVVSYLMMFFICLVMALSIFLFTRKAQWK
jgi:MFS family permease